jgi:hypothetical protein
VESARGKKVGTAGAGLGSWSFLLDSVSYGTILDAWSFGK